MDLSGVYSKFQIPDSRSTYKEQTLVIARTLSPAKGGVEGDAAISGGRDHPTRRGVLRLWQSHLAEIATLPQDSGRSR